MKAIDPGSRDKGRNDSQGFSLIPGGRFAGDSDGHMEHSGPAGARKYRAGILKVPHRMAHQANHSQCAGPRTRSPATQTDSELQALRGIQSPPPKIFRVRRGSEAPSPSSLTGHREKAALVLHALARQIRPDGSLWFSYNTKNTWPDEMSHDFGQVRGGAIAWCGYAFSLYLDMFPPKNTDPAGLARERVRFLKAATDLAEYLLSLQIQDPTSQRYGLMLGGWGRVGLRFNSQRGEVEEVYSPGPVPFVSTENNISIYFFLTKLAKITGEDRYAQAAESIAQSLARALWDESGAQFWMGFNGPDEVNRGGALDCASWGALFWLARGDSDRARRSLETGPTALLEP